MSWYGYYIGWRLITITCLVQSYNKPLHCSFVMMNDTISPFMTLCIRVAQSPRILTLKTDRIKSIHKYSYIWSPNPLEYVPNCQRPSDIHSFLWTNVTSLLVPIGATLCFLLKTTPFSSFARFSKDFCLAAGGVDVSLVWGLRTNDYMPLLGQPERAWHFEEGDWLALMKWCFFFLIFQHKMWGRYIGKYGLVVRNIFYFSIQLGF